MQYCCVGRKHVFLDPILDLQGGFLSPREYTGRLTRRRHDAGYFGGTLGMGFYAVYPSLNPVIFDFGGLIGHYLNSSGGDAAWEPEELLVLRVTMNINLY